MKNIPFGRPMIGDEERNAVLEVLNGPILVHGPRSKAFEKAFCSYTGAPYANSVSSCTAAMHLYYFHLGLGPGDEVIVPAQTHTSTAHAVELTGAKPVFVDAENRTGNIDIDQIEGALTENTKAISVVHYLGVPVDMDRVNAIAQKYGLSVIEDCALAVGTRKRGVHAGLLGDVGCFSFYPVKHMTTAEGGMVTTKDEDVYSAIQRKRAFGVDRHMGERIIPGVYDVNTLGFNYRMNEMQAAIGMVQLNRMNNFLKRREENYASLKKGLKEIDELAQFSSPEKNDTSSHYCFSFLLNENLAIKRFEIVQSLKENGVGTSVYYPKPVPHMSYYKAKYGYKDSDFPEAARISYRSIALPVGPHLNLDDMEYIVDMLKRAIMEVK